MRNAGLDEAKAGIKITRRNINNFIYADDTTLMVESKEEQKSLLMKVKEESEKAGLNLTIQITMLMACSPITWQMDGEIMEAVTGFIFLGPQITADGDCSHEIKRCFLLGRKAITNPDSILSRDITLPTKFCLVKAVFFFSRYEWMLELDPKAEHQRIDAFELWCWRRLLSPFD